MPNRDHLPSLLMQEALEAARGLDAWRSVWTGCAQVLPSFTFPRVRTQLLRYAGPEIGPRTAFLGPVRIVGPRGALSNLRVGSDSVIAPDVVFGLDASIEIGAGVSVGPGAALYTGTHDLGAGSRRMSPRPSPRPIVVEDGVWIGMNALILAGVRIGHGAVVAAGAVVGADVPPDVLVGGNPAVVMRSLPFGDR